jgi:hypothetical protein
MIDELKIKEMIENGFAIQKIATLLKYPHAEVKETVNKNNWDIVKEEFSEDKIDYIKELYKQGVSVKNLGFKFSIDKRRVQKWVEDLTESREINKDKIYGKFDEHIFDNMDYYKKAYWLGYLYSNLYIHYDKLIATISLNVEYIDQLEKFAKFISMPLDKISYYSRGEFKYGCITLYGKYICDKLKELGCKTSQTHILQYPTYFDNRLQLHFIRGLFDGNGSIIKNKNGEWKWSIATSKNCCNFIKEYISKNAGIEVGMHSLSDNEDSTNELITSGNEKVLKILNFIYNSSLHSTRLNKKYNRFLELQDKQDNRNYKNSTDRDHYLLTEEEISEIVDEIENKISYEHIAKKYKINIVTVEKIGQKFYKNKTA